MKICKECGKEFSTRDNRVKYCSADCRLNHEKKRSAEYHHNSYYPANKEKIAEKNRKYRAENKEKFAKYQRKYCAENKEKVAEYRRKYYLKKIWGDEN